MKFKNITQEELETMPLDDLAYIILKEKNKKMKTIDIFKIISVALGFSDKEFEEKIADFFTLLATEKRFIQLEKGFWDLRENHTSKITLDEIEEAAEEDDLLIDKDNHEDKDSNLEDEEGQADYFDSALDVEDEESDDDLKDLVIIDSDIEERDL